MQNRYKVSLQRHDEILTRSYWLHVELGKNI
jgi:hypothetical protein